LHYSFPLDLLTLISCSTDHQQFVATAALLARQDESSDVRSPNDYGRGGAQTADAGTEPIDGRRWF
jgi:hypothetical protein